VIRQQFSDTPTIIHYRRCHRRPWTAVCQQGDDLREAFIREVQSVKWRPLGRGKGLAANRTFAAALLLRMNRDGAFFQSASSWASQIRTKYRQWVQSHNSLRSGIQKGLSLDLGSIQNSAQPRFTVELSELQFSHSIEFRTVRIRTCSGKIAGPRS